MCARVLQDRAVGAGALHLRTSMSGQEAQEQLRAASAAVAKAFRSFRAAVKSDYTTSRITTAAVAATFSGFGARLNPVVGGYSKLQATREVNSQTSTVRSSSSSLGLELASDMSRLSSSALGLDVTSPETASTLESSAAIGLNLTESTSTIASTEEMNRATTSYGSTTLSFTGPGPSSTSVATLSGTYTGVDSAASATSLTVKQRSGALVNDLLPVHVRFDVVDQSNNVLFSYNGNLKAGDQVYLGDDIGLTISFSAGTLRNNHSGSTTVSHGPVDVDANATFNNATAALRPEFENGAQVTAGSFTVNGTNIAVNANDTISAVLARINASGAGVTAALANDHITLTSNSYSESDIVLAGDTSGFLTATKLATATTVRGNVRDDQQALSQTAQFGSVASGSFTINGVAISVDKNIDTLSSIVAKINTAGAGVTASYNSSEDKLVLTSNTNSEDEITVAGDSTGFLTAAKLSTGNTVRGNLRDDQQVFSKTSQFAALTNGSFTVNGKTISVDIHQDSVATVVGKINSAGAGVTASFNASTNALELASNGASEDLISVGSDTTGLLSAAGLSATNTVRGKVADDRQSLATTTQFADVASGSFTVNGIVISVDRGTDSLQDVIGRINSSGAGVTASYDTNTDKLVFRPDVSGATLALEDDTSGLLAAAGVATGVVGTRVRADAAFNASGATGPLFDPGLSVQAGSFTVNGVTIAVAADDTLNNVLARITASDAGVVASFDSEAETVTLTSTRASTDPVTVGNDTSGFLAAVKLDGTALSTQAQSVSPFDAALGQIAEYSEVQAGTLTVNGHQIAIDPASSTIRGIVASLNGVQGLRASLDEVTGRISVSSTQSNTVVSVADTSGILSTLGITPGTYTGTPEKTSFVETVTRTRVVGNGRDVARRVFSAVEPLNDVLAQFSEGRDADPGFRSSVEAAIGAAVDSLKHAGVRGFAVGPNARELSVDRGRLAASLDELGGKESGLVASIERILTGLAEQVTSLGGATQEKPVQGLQAINLKATLKAMLKAEQASASLLALKSSVQSGEQGAAKAKAADAYAEKKAALEEVRTQLVSSPSASPLSLLEWVREWRTPDAAMKQTSAAYGIQKEGAEKDRPVDRYAELLRS